MDITGKTLLVLIPILMGLFCRLVGLFDEAEGAALRKFVVRFTVPIFVFFSLYDARPESIAAIVPMAASFVTLTAVMFALGWVASIPFKGSASKAAVHACVTFGNYGWMGLGVAHALFGPEGTQRVVYFILLWWPAFYAFGLGIGFVHAGERKGGVPIRHAVTLAAPPLIAVAIGLTLNMRQVLLPDLVVGVLRPFGDMTVPLILLSVGVMLDPRQLGTALRPALVVTALTLVAGPLIGWAVGSALTRDPVSFSVVVLEGAMPVATLTPLLEEHYEMDVNLVSTAIVLSTALSLATVPLTALALGG